MTRITLGLKFKCVMHWYHEVYVIYTIKTTSNSPVLAISVFVKANYTFLQDLSQLRTQHNSTRQNDNTNNSRQNNFKNPGKKFKNSNNSLPEGPSQIYNLSGQPIPTALCRFLYLIQETDALLYHLTQVHVISSSSSSSSDIKNENTGNRRSNPNNNPSAAVSGHGNSNSRLDSLYHESPYFNINHKIWATLRSLNTVDWYRWFEVELLDVIWNHPRRSDVSESYNTHHQSNQSPHHQSHSIHPLSFGSLPKPSLSAQSSDGDYGGGSGRSSNQHQNSQNNPSSNPSNNPNNIHRHASQELDPGLLKLLINWTDLAISSLLFIKFLTPQTPQHSQNSQNSPTSRSEKVNNSTKRARKLFYHTTPFLIIRVKWKAEYLASLTFGFFDTAASDRQSYLNQWKTLLSETNMLSNLSGGTLPLNLNDHGNVRVSVSGFALRKSSSRTQLHSTHAHGHAQISEQDSDDSEVFVRLSLSLT